MIALTQEKREELIQYAKFTSAQYDHDEVLCEIMEIALASLTADKLSKDASESLIAMVEYALSHRMCMGMDEGFKSFDPDVEHDFVQEIRNFIASGDSFFTAPPVPEIKLPEKLNAGEIHYELTEKYGLDVSIDQLERGLAEEVYSVAVNNFERLNGLGD